MRYPFLTAKIRQDVFNHIQTTSLKKEIYVELINGYVDHVHCLLSLGVNQNTSEIVGLIKGESSFWVNQQELTQKRFGWQKDFYARSVNPTNYNQLRNYINNQEQHHKKVTFANEYEKLIKDLAPTPPISPRL